MADSIGVISKSNDDARARVLKNKLEEILPELKSVSIVDTYKLDLPINSEELQSVANILTNPVIEKNGINVPVFPQNNFNWVLEVGFLPGVTDNVASTVKEGIENIVNKKFDNEQKVYTSKVIFLEGDIEREKLNDAASVLGNPIINAIRIKSASDFFKDEGMGFGIPKVTLDDKIEVSVVDILSAPDKELKKIGKEGILNSDGSSRGPLALDFSYMKTIQAYFKNLKRNPNDIEIEMLAQTWSEHCKHTIFADPIDDIKEGLFKKYIKGSTEKIRALKGDKDFCVSVFSDNAGGLVFDDDYVFVIKAETHNTPSALDPFGGSITGIVGVNRDIMGFGIGAKPVINMYGFCFADPDDTSPIYKGKNFTQKMLPPEQIMSGVIEGVNSGGNTSGIPTNLGFMMFDSGYKGKPLVFVGTAGIIKKEIAGKPSHEKQARPGDYVVMVGGRVGKDGIHGATFSSEAMDSGSPSTAVQIGDPITQKKMSDALVKEAMQLELYNSITDNGAGGLSCSVAEMAKESGGCVVDLEKVPVKYQGLQPWEIWISESQERMTLAVPGEKWNEFNDLMIKRGVEATVIGEFTKETKCIVNYEGKKIVDLDMDFLHNGLPQRPMNTTYTKKISYEPELNKQMLKTIKSYVPDFLLGMLSSNNIASNEFISNQYDHEVQGGSVLKPLQGKGRVNASATVTKPVLESNKAVVLSQGINPAYSEFDTYAMAAAAIDSAIRRNIAAGGKLEHMALMDNFCWCSSDEPERLGQLKAAVEACHDYSIAFETPFISGKDSMFNDFKGYDENGDAIKISIPPTLLITAVSVIDDSTKAVSMDAKFAGDLVYIIGETKPELGGSEYYKHISFNNLVEDKMQIIENKSRSNGKRYVVGFVPQTDAQKNIFAYKALSNAIQNDLVASAQSVDLGGLAVELSKVSMAGKLGMEIELEKIPVSEIMREDQVLFSQSTGRIIVTVSPDKKEAFEKIMRDSGDGEVVYSNIGKITNDSKFKVYSHQIKGNILDLPVEKMLESYRSTFKDK